MQSKILIKTQVLTGFGATRKPMTLKRVMPTANELTTGVVWSKKYQNHVPAKVKIGNKTKLFKSILISLGLLNVAIFTAYLIGVNTYASSGYEIKRLQKEIGENLETQKQLNANLSERNSLLGIENSFSELGFTANVNSNYFSSPQYTHR